MARTVALILPFLLLSAVVVAAQSLTVVAQPTDTVEESEADTVDTDLDILTAHRDGPDTVEYSAYDLQYNVQTRTFNLSNKAQLKYRGAVLDADTIYFNQKDEVLQAMGSPILTDQQNPPLAGYRMKYNMKNRIGQIYYGSSIRDGQYFNGVEIRRLPDTRLQISRGDFSSCDDKTHQNYYFYSRRLVVKPKDNFVARPVVLNIGDVPVAVLPLLVSPMKTGRKSGLLTPKFGGDQQQGFYMQNLGAYWAINDYMDATMKGDVIEGSEARFERSSAYAEFNYNKRYVLNGRLSGRLYLEEFDLSSSGWELNYSHNQNLTPDGKSRLSGEGSFISSPTIRVDNSLEKDVILNQQANASLGWTWQMKNNKTMILQARQAQNLQTGLMERQIPDFRFNMSGALFQPLLNKGLSDDWRFLERFQYTLSERANVFYQRSPDTTQNIDTSQIYFGNSIQGSLFWSGQVLRHIILTPRMNYRGDWTANRWANALDPDQRYLLMDFPKDDKGLFYSTSSYSLSADTKLYGIWLPEWGRFTGVRHTLSPNVAYTFSPQKDTLHEFVLHPRLDGQRNYQSKSKTVSFSLGNYFDLKYRKALSANDTTASKKDADDYANLRLLSTNHSTGYNFAADSFHWSPISSNFSLQLVHNYIFSVQTQHSVYHHYEENPSQVRIPQLTSWGFNLSRSFNWNGAFGTGVVGEKMEQINKPWNSGFSYSFGFNSRRVGRNLFQNDMSHASSVNLRMAPTQTWAMSYGTSYDYRRGEFAEHRFSFDKDLHCWNMNFTWTPVGVAAGWSFQIAITELPDIKLQAGSTTPPR